MMKIIQISIFEIDKIVILYMKMMILNIKKSDERNLKHTNICHENDMLLKENVKVFSPKFYNILKNSEKYQDSDGNPTGKIMYYSDFRQESGSEIFEEILKANGYEKFDHTKGSVEDMNESDKRFKIYIYYWFKVH